MDSGSFQQGFQYNFQPFGEADMSMASATLVPVLPAATAAMLPPMSTPSTGTQSMASAMSTMIPPLHTLQAPAGTSNEGESSFNDSGYFSSPQTSQFTALHSRLQASSSSQLVGSYNHSPSRTASSAVTSLMATTRPSWQEDFPNINDEWDRNFINSFEENLFGIDAADLNHMVDGILASPLKSPCNSPFKSPRQNRSAAQGLGLSPFSYLSTVSVMPSGIKKSPAHLDGSPFRNLFSTPSPIKGLNPHSRISPVTRQCRRILQSPAQKSDVFDHFLELPDFLQNINKEMEQSDDLGVTPFQRTNSLGFTPSEEIPASPSFPTWHEENSAPSSCPLAQSNQSVTVTSTLQEINLTQPRQHKKIKTESLYNLRNSPAKKEMTCYKQQSPSSKRSPARLAHGRISVTHHSHLVDKLDPKGALRFVRARFSEVLKKAVAEAEKRDADMQSRLKGRVRKQQYPEISQALAQPVAGSSSRSQSSTSIPCYTQIQPHRPAGKRRQEILPKPTPDWPQRQPCKIAPKKRKR